MTSDREFLDGPGLCAWLDEQGYVMREANLAGMMRTVRRWRSGDSASVWTVDEVLTRLGSHLSEVPDDLWRGSPIPGGNNKHPRISPRIRQAALTAIRRGDTISHVAARYAISDSVIRRWMKAERLFPAGADPRPKPKKVAA